MPNKLGLSKEAERELTELAGKKLGIDPEKLRKQLNEGALDETLGPVKAGQIKQILSDKQQLERLLNSPGAKEILKKLMK